MIKFPTSTNTHTQVHTLSPSSTPPQHCWHFSNFQLPNDSLISDLIRKSKTLHLSAWSNPHHPGQILPTIFASPHFCHHSLFTHHWNCSSIPQNCSHHPILKNPGSDPNNYNNLHPISNLPFISKILEKLVATQLHTHLTQNSLYDPFHSGFYSHHSTQAALIQITNDLLVAADCCSLSILLDLSAAFDTISHPELSVTLLPSSGTPYHPTSVIPTLSQFSKPDSKPTCLKLPVHSTPNCNTTLPLLLLFY